MEKLLSTLKDGWRQPRLHWKEALEGWPQSSFSFSKTEDCASLIRDPEIPGGYLQVIETVPPSLYDADNMEFVGDRGLKRSDFIIEELEKSSFALFVSRALQVTQQQPVEVIRDSAYLLGTEHGALVLLLDILPRQIVNSVKRLADLYKKSLAIISISPWLKDGYIRDSLSEFRLIRLVHISEVLQAVSPGQFEQTSGLDALGWGLNANPEPLLPIKRPPGCGWEHLHITIHTDERDSSYTADINKEALFAVYRVDGKIVARMPKAIPLSKLPTWGDKKPKLYHNGAHTDLWLLLRAYAKGSGIIPAPKSKDSKKLTNTNRNNLSNWLCAAFGFSQQDRPFKFASHTASESRFHIEFAGDGQRKSSSYGRR